MFAKVCSMSPLVSGERIQCVTPKLHEVSPALRSTPNQGSTEGRQATTDFWMELKKSFRLDTWGFLEQRTQQPFPEASEAVWDSFN